MTEEDEAAREPAAESSQQDAEPADDLVTTRHGLTIKRRKLGYTATAGRIELREEVHTEGAFEGHQPRAELFVGAYTLDRADPSTCHVRLQR